MQKSDRINALAKNLEKVLNKNNILKKEEAEKTEDIKEKIIYQNMTEINEDNNNIQITQNKKKKTFQNFEDN